MKKLFICLAATLIATSGFAQNTNSTGNVNKKVVLAENPTALVINGSISVVLLNDNSKEIWMEGTKEIVEGWLVKEKKTPWK